MEALYKRERGHNYLFFLHESEEQETKGDFYRETQIEMIRRNKIPGLVPFHMEWEDNRKFYGYDITGMQPIARLIEFELISGEEIRELLSQMVQVLFKLDQYLLERNYLVLEPEYLYRCPDSGSYGFLFYTDQEGEYQDHMKLLAQYLLAKVCDEEGIFLRFVLRFYQLCMEGEPEPERIMEFLAEKRQQERSMTDEGKEDPEFWEEGEWEEEQEEKGRKTKTGWSMAQEKKGIRRRLREWLYGRFMKNSCAAGEMWDELEQERELFEKEKGMKGEEQPTELLCREKTNCESPFLLFVEKNEKIAVSKTPFFIGTRKGTDYNPGFGGVSRLHIKVEKRNEEYWIIDLNSTNGTRLNGEDLNPNEARLLAAGDEIWIGGLLYEWKLN